MHRPAGRARRDAFTEAFQRMPGMNGALLADVLSTLPNDMLHKVDLTSMAHALEVRTPFLDLRVVEFAFSLPPEAKLVKGSGKHILRETFGHLLPATVMTRSKKGFEVPLQDLLRGPPWPHSWMPLCVRKQWKRRPGLDRRCTGRCEANFVPEHPGHHRQPLHALLVYLSWWKAHVAA
jgi:asparagine synthase (glutamine-hydrolysing)